MCQRWCHFVAHPHTRADLRLPDGACKLRAFVILPRPSLFLLSFRTFSQDTNPPPSAVLPYSIFNPQSASFTGCACANNWFLPALTSGASVQIKQGAQGLCNPSDSSNGPWAEVSTITNTPDWYNIVPDCSKWLGDNSANPTPGNNPCSAFPVTSIYTASCSYV